MRAFRHLFAHGMDHDRVRMAQEHRPVAGPIVHQFVAVDVPFPRPALPLDVNGEWFHRPQVVRDAGREHRPSLLEPATRTEKLSDITIDEHFWAVKVRGVGIVQKHIAVRQELCGKDIGGTRFAGEALTQVPVTLDFACRVMKVCELMVPTDLSGEANTRQSAMP